MKLLIALCIFLANSPAFSQTPAQRKYIEAKQAILSFSRGSLSQANVATKYQTLMEHLEDLFSEIEVLHPDEIVPEAVSLALDISHLELVRDLFVSDMQKKNERCSYVQHMAKMMGTPDLLILRTNKHIFSIVCGTNLRY